MTIKQPRSTDVELVQLEPYGINLWGEGMRPVLLLKGEMKTAESRRQKASGKRKKKAGMTSSSVDGAQKATTPREITLTESSDKIEDASIVFGQEQVVLSVPLNAIEAGVTLSQANKSSRPVTIHRAVQSIFQSLKLEITRCVFEEVRGQRQYVRLYFKNHPLGDSIVVAAEDAMSLCLFLEVPLYASRKVIEESRTLMMEMDGVMEGLKLNPQLLKRNHTYIQ